MDERDALQGVQAVGAVLFWLSCAGYAARVAGAKGWNAALWFLGAVCFGPVALLGAVGMPRAPEGKPQ